MLQYGILADARNVPTAQEEGVCVREMQKEREKKKALTKKRVA